MDLYFHMSILVIYVLPGTWVWDLNWEHDQQDEEGKRRVAWNGNIESNSFIRIINYILFEWMFIIVLIVIVS